MELEILFITKKAGHWTEPLNPLHTLIFLFKICFHKYADCPVTVVERSKACTVFARSEAVIMGSNPTQGMDV
jgi:hypothetical protein